MLFWRNAPWPGKKYRYQYTLPGGANLSDINRGLSTSPFPILPPLFKPRENQSAILDTLAYLLSNQQVIVTELKAIKEKIERLTTDISKERLTVGMEENHMPTFSR